MEPYENERNILPPGGLFSLENFSRESQSLTVASAKALSQYHLLSETYKKEFFLIFYDKEKWHIDVSNFKQLDAFHLEFCSHSQSSSMVTQHNACTNCITDA